MKNTASRRHTGQFNDVGVITKPYNVSEILHHPPPPSPTLDIYQDESQDNSPRLSEKGVILHPPPPPAPKATEVKLTYCINIQFDSSPETH